MSPQPAYPRTAASHEVTAAGVLELHARTTGWRRELPIPVESIVVASYGMRAIWQDIAELRRERILAEINPKARVIALNQRHSDELLDNGNLPPFRLAHLLGHYLYDADHGSALIDHPVFCRAPATAEANPVRETNADGFAVALLLPTVLVRAQVARGPRRPQTRLQLQDRAAGWGVSAPVLRARLQELSLDWSLPAERPTRSAGPRS